MIVTIEGKIVKKEPPVLWLATNQGITYEILLPINHFENLNTPTAFVYTHLLIREDAHFLFGFLDLKTCNLFKLLIKISGVGAKTALAILSSFTLAEFQNLAINKDINQLIKVPGIGRKTAQRMMVDIAGFMDKLVLEDNAQKINNYDSLNQAKKALNSLGFKDNEINKLLVDLDPNQELTSLIKNALAKKRQ